LVPSHARPWSGVHIARSLIVEHGKRRGKSASKHAAEFTTDHKSELTTAAATAFVVGLAARVSGFKAGYEFAQNNIPTA
jgi:hypothetical protein